jgi:hypothetical protein
MNAANLAVVGPAETIPVKSETAAMIGMVERLARDPSIPMERIQGLMDMARELRREQAEEAFNEAMAAAQREMTPIARDSFNPQTRSKYASYNATDRAIRPIYTRHGLAVSFDEAPDAPEGFVRVLAFVSRGRHTRTHHYDSPIVTKGLKGNDMMTLTHGRASAVTYAKRYLVGMIFNLSTGDDDDGIAHSSADDSGPISPEQLEELIRLADEVGADKRAFSNYFKIDGMAQLPAKDFDRAIAALNKKRERQ